MEFQVRIDEHDKTSAQIAQREATYNAARILKQHGIKCQVREFFTGSSQTADAAAIILDLRP